MSAADPRAVFVYGTLLPGHCRWPLVASYVDAHRPATVAGRLYDTRRDYPAAVFDDEAGAGELAGVGAPVVHGALRMPPLPESHEELLEAVKKELA